jgi:hypothetical protein
VEDVEEEGDRVMVVVEEDAERGIITILAMEEEIARTNLKKSRQMDGVQHLRRKKLLHKLLHPLRLWKKRRM